MDAVNVTTIPPSAAPPRQSPSAIRWFRQNLFDGWFNTLLTVLSVAFLVWLIPNLFRWAVTNAVTGAASPEACREAAGACWAFVHEKYRLILFGTYPYVEQWRPLLATCLFIALIAASGYKGFWRRELAIVWALTLALMGVLLWGGVLGLT